MSVRQSLLAILDQGPCYGYQLRAEFARRTGSSWPLNVGQIYNTLDRLERDGLVAKGEIDAEGHVYYRITDAGSTEVAAWLAAPVERGPASRNELAVKVAVAATLPGVDLGALLQEQRRASLARHDALIRTTDAASPGEPEELARAIVADAMILHAQAELRWLDLVEERLARHPERAIALELATDRPKRGRPARAA
ncbi:PadR family transcriptional regulator [Microbacterium sp.]|uniref:PadR family transcriptional regulator n=1 Tax=Microbacterium sp. TaxID=51671 RepID=UPI002E32C2EC|nr:PadR family transcriptional regulator [Microbacterium sp.]HEX5730197.1 PadR family transcriptional regulator [Microbacterium sp.]